MKRNAALELVGIVGLVAAWHIGFVMLDGASLIYGAQPNSRHRMLSTDEIALFGLVASATLLGWLLPVPERPHRATRAIPTWLWACVPIICTIALGTFVTHWLPFTDDESAYRIQGRSLLTGRAVEHAALPEGSWSNPFVIAVAPENELSLWSGVYPWMAGAWTMPGLVVGFENLLWVPLGALMVVLVRRITRRWYGDEPSRIAAIALATSPALIGLSVFKHTSLLAAVWTLLLVDVATARRRWWTDLILGMLAGTTMLTRPVEGALVLIGLAAWVIWEHTAKDEPPSTLLTRLVRVSAGGCPPLVLWLWHNEATTGNMLVMPYKLLFDGAPVYGFGATAYGVHTPFRAFMTVVTVASRFVGWTLGWPLVVFIGIAATWRELSRAPVLRLALLATAVHIAVYVPAPFGQVPTVGITYSIWLLPIVTLAMAELAHRSSVGFSRRVLRTILLGWLTFVPWMVMDVAHEMTFVREPLRLAQDLQRHHGKVLLLYENFVELQGHTYVLHPPLPSDSEDPVLWWRADFGEDEEAKALLLNPGRAAFRVSWSEDDQPVLRFVRVR